MSPRGRYQRRRPLPTRVREAVAKPAAADVVMAAVVVATAVARYTILTDRAAPATVDSGNWLAFGHALLGESPRSGSIVYPPLVPVLTTLLSDAFGPIVAVGLMGAVSSILAAVAIYVVLRAAGLRWSAVLLAGLLAASASIGEAAAWGGFPQLIGLALVTVFLVLLDRALAHPTWLAAAWTGLVFALVLFTSHFAATFAIVAAGFVVLLAWLASPRPGRFRWLGARWRIAATCAIPVVLVVPIYRPLLAAIAGNRPEGTDTATATVGWSNLIETVEFTYRETPLLWRALVLFALCAPFALRDRWRAPEWRLPVAALLAIVIGTLGTHESRFLAFLPPVLVASAGLWVLAGRDAVGRPRTVVRGLVAAAAIATLAFQSYAGIDIFRDQRDFYGIVAPGTFRGMQWLRATTDPDTTLGVATVDDAPLGWWFEGYVERPTYYASPLRWLSFPDELRRAEVANAIFTASFPDETSLPRARASGIDLLVVPTGSNRFDPDRMEGFLRTHPGTVAFRDRDLIILRTRPI